MAHKDKKNPSIVCSLVCALASATEPAAAQEAMMPASSKPAPPGNADWTISLAGLIGGKALRVVLASRDGQFARAVCPAGQYNAETHEVDASGLRLLGDTIGGTMKVTLYADAWFPKDRKDVVCELSVDARAAGQEVSGRYAGTRNRAPVEGALSGSIAAPSVPAKQAVSRLRFENAITGVPNYKARARLDVEWVDGTPRDSRIRCGFKVPQDWAGRMERIAGRLSAESLQLDLQGMVGMQPGGTSIGAEQWTYSLRGTVVGTSVTGHFTATVNGRQEREGRFQGEIVANGALDASYPDDQASAVTKPREAVAVDARTATGGEVIMPWRSIALEDFQGGLYAIGDLDGDGQCEFVVARDGLTGLVVYKLDGSVLWQWGRDRPGSPMSCDMPLQVWDIAGKGRDDVFIGVQGHLLILDGRTGQEIKRCKLPEGLGWADCITFANFRGLERARDIIVKTRHGAMWAYTDDWRLLWQWAPPAGYQACHHPQPVDVDGDGKDELIAGWSLLGPDGKPLWTMKSAISELKNGHCDSSAVVRTGRKPADARLAICYDNDNGLGLLDGEGRMLWEIGGSHFQLVIAGKMRADVPGNQIVTTIAYGRNDPTWILAEDGRLLVDILHAGNYSKFLDWDGDGLLELISSRAKVFNGKGQCVAELGLAEKMPSRESDDSPQRAVPANAVMVVDVDGDRRPEAVLFSWPGPPTGTEASPGAPRIRIYKSDQTPQLKDPPRRTFNFTLYN